jgi:hypothetical protein
VRLDRHGHPLGAADGRLAGQAFAVRRGFATAGHDLIRIGRHGGGKDGSPVLLATWRTPSGGARTPLIGVGL